MQQLKPARPRLDQEYIDQQVKQAMRVFAKSEPEARAAVMDGLAGEWFMNDTYTVIRRDGGPGWWWLSIRRNDRAPARDWRDLQAIKDQLVGPGHEGLELYPARERVLDAANQYHLWVLKDPRARLPVGFATGGVMDAGGTFGEVQRPLDDADPEA